ncbi:phage portal protein [Phycisphaerales bacterium AB-hyl4]|uniref:Phage portal protein n=1 Tax=Natronomicrosphaera hydrolytica TaxID=3242702 RepID=A0ABV4U4I4_9BACT
MAEQQVQPTAPIGEAAGVTNLPAPSAEGYDATRETPRRKPPRTKLRSEDQTLLPKERSRLTATTRDINRNFAIVAWMVRKHLDYVASHTFQATTADDGFNRELEAWLKEWSKRENCDVAGRHRLDRQIRLAEGRRCIDGDMLVYRLATGRLQAIEGDRCRLDRHNLPRDLDPMDWTHGVRTNQAGKALAYMICNRARYGAGFEFRTILPARHVYQHAFFDRFDQVRGVSPIAAGVNTFRDAYDGIDYALVRAKVSQLFALAITTKDAEEEEDGEASEYDVAFDKGPIQLNLDPGDDAKFLESNQPSDQFRHFMQVCIAVALKSLDIPFSFYDESFTNFYGSRGGLMQYLKSCKAKRRDVQEMLDWISEWRIGLAIQDGDLRLPRGWDRRDVTWQWVPDGVPWWDPAKEARGHAMSVAAGFDTFEHVVRETGGGTGDIYENLRANAKVLAFAKELGVPLVLPGAAAFNPPPAVGSNDEESEGSDAK